MQTASSNSINLIRRIAPKGKNMKLCTKSNEELTVSSDQSKTDKQYEYLTDQERRDEWKTELARDVVREKIANRS